MKNIHILPTHLPSLVAMLPGKELTYSKTKQLFTPTVDWKTQNIYITNSEEIKEGYDVKGKWVMSEYGFVTKADRIEGNYLIHENGGSNFLCHYRFVIITTDPELIKNGVQEVPEYFLKWFIVGKNPIEYVEIKPHLESLDTMKNSYEIIIPQPKQEINIDDVAISSKQIFTLKQETIDDARKNYISDINCELYNEQTNETIKSFASDAFEQGAEWYYKKTLEMFTKLVVRSCFKSDRDYKVAKQTLLEITGIDYENEVDKNTNTRNR